MAEPKAAPKPPVRIVNSFIRSQNNVAVFVTVHYADADGSRWSDEFASSLYQVVPVPTNLGETGMLIPSCVLPPAGRRESSDRPGRGDPGVDRGRRARVGPGQGSRFLRGSAGEDREHPGSHPELGQADRSSARGFGEHAGRSEEVDPMTNQRGQTMKIPAEKEEYVAGVFRNAIRSRMETMDELRTIEKFLGYDIEGLDELVDDYAGGLDSSDDVDSIDREDIVTEINALSQDDTRNAACEKEDG